MNTLNAPPIKSPAWHRARMEAIPEHMTYVRQIIARTENDPKSYVQMQRALRQLQWGYTKEAFSDEVIDQALSEKKYSEEPLTVAELMSFDTWFVMHPEKIAGVEQVSTSRDFPIKVKGNRQTVENTIREGLPKKQDDMDEIREKAKSLRNKFKGLKGTLLGLGELQTDVQQEISQNTPVIRHLLERSKNEKDHSSTDKQSFDEIVSRYNEGISEEEIQAWVWYKRSLGVPMSGWKQYFISGADSFEQLITTEETIIKDNHFRDLYTAPAGKVLGRPTKKEHTYDGNSYIIFRDGEGLKWANKKHTRKDRSGGLIDESALTKMIKNGHLYYMEGELVPYPVYAYGNMYDRELELRASKEYIIGAYGQDVYDRHERVISENKPEPLSVTNPESRFRPKILAISEFADEFRVETLREDTGVVFEEPSTLVEAFKDWLRSLGKENFQASDLKDIINYYLNGERIRDDKLTKEQKAEIRTNARNEAEELFERFLHEALTFEDQLKLDAHWNRLYNGQSSLPYHKIPVGFEVSAKFKQFNLEIRPAQREAIAFMEALGSGIIAYDVGVGKTMSGIIAAANALFSGQCKRPLIVVPKDTYDKWIKEVIGFKSKKGEFVPGILSNTGITVNEWYNLGTDILKKIKSDKPVNENSITVVTYEGFRKIGFSVDAQESMFTELVNALSQSVQITERDKELEYSKFREKIGIGNKGTELDIDVMKFDYFIIDEAHRCKNIFEGVKKDNSGRRRFGIQGAVSELGIKAFFLCNYVQRTHGRNVCLLTATPFTNSPLEIYAMLSLVAYHGMKRMGLYNIRSFFELFVQETTEWVVNYAEEVVPRDVVKRFNNRLVLQKLIYNHVNYKTGEEAGVKRPCKINLPKTSKVDGGRIVKLNPKDQILTYLRMTPRQRDNQIAIVGAAVSAAKRRSKSGIFRALSQSLNNALSPFLIDGSPEDYMDFVEQSPKIKYICECIRSVKEYHEERNEPVSSQVIYLNRGKHFFPLIKEYLEKQVGYKTNIKYGRMVLDEVEIITGDVSDAKKENIKEAFNEGIVKVIIGTSTIREGIDLQRKSTVLHNGYPDWNPTDLRQLEGRIWRQGNEHAFVRIVMPLVQDSMDVFVFQKLEEKTARINDIWYRGDRGNVLDLESLDPEEIKFALISDVKAIANLRREFELKEQQRKIELLNVRQKVFVEYQTDIGEYEQMRENLATVLEEFRKVIAHHDYAKNRLTPKELERRPEDEQILRGRIIKMHEAFLKYIEQPNRTDRDMLGLMRKLEKWWPRDFAHKTHQFKLYKFPELVKKKAQAEKMMNERFSVLETPDLNKIVEELNKEIEAAQEELEHIQSEDHMNDLVREAEYKKSASRVEGKDIIDRVEEFSRLNYLLSVRFNPERANTCTIPSKEELQQDEDEDLDRLRLRAVALKLKMKFRKAA